MATLLSESDFRGEVNIPGTERIDVCEELTRFIEEYEPQFLEDVLGIDLAAEVYTQAALVSGRDAIWDLLITGGTWSDTRPTPTLTRRTKGLKYCAARYVYWHYTKNKHTLSSNVGEVKPATDNAVGTSPALKMVTAWNQMARELNTELWELLRYYEVSDAPAYTLYDYNLPAYWKYQRVNTFGF